MPSRSAASKPSRRTTTKVAPTGYSATIVPWFDLLKSSTNTYVPGFSARTRMLTVLPGGTTFSNRSEERRVGKECRYWWSPYHSKKNKKEKTESCEYVS